MNDNTNIIKIRTKLKKSSNIYNGWLSYDKYYNGVVDDNYDDTQTTAKDKALKIIKQLDEDEEVFSEFNLIIRSRKLKKIKNNIKTQ